ncbi:MAG: hypothetical protein AUJ52_13395 [Elusimicrobia bacterium CG1_02_63_36]|nr:MAG: hypothetical protein AUJ52_13395 [Elusimicrobia bacterium CG1_02_63_36]PIP83561.1 MAG: hypothetical protein COR54_08900 [Elusimicrobia bacterium CG22_combo_CG10-13_8_21_14_all_63_91]PJA13141.1 MAG: hypothetical protein COX66_15750 [Elusimicrobia bacterium CG_4_10_14_0_2_um_filter_63_34]PJB26066.1 MAG: hypothetical protein CO113_05505 [Elusimicrobia bacterium CG_4_9_14_3_um_filter_62_55]
MRYWTLSPEGSVSGPFDPSQIAGIDGFGAETRVCPERFYGSGDHAWLRAGFISELRAMLPPAERLLPPDPSQAEVRLLGSLEERVAELEELLLDSLDRLRERGRAVKALEAENLERGKDVLRLRTALKKISLRVGALGSLEAKLLKMSALLDTREEIIGAVRQTFEAGLETAARTAAETAAEAHQVIREAERIAEAAVAHAEKAEGRAKLAPVRKERRGKRRRKRRRTEKSREDLFEPPAG